MINNNKTTNADKISNQHKIKEIEAKIDNYLKFQETYTEKPSKSLTKKVKYDAIDDFVNNKDAVTRTGWLEQYYDI